MKCYQAMFKFHLQICGQLFLMAPVRTLLLRYAHLLLDLVLCVLNSYRVHRFNNCIRNLADIYCGSNFPDTPDLLYEPWKLIAFISGFYCI